MHRVDRSVASHAYHKPILRDLGRMDAVTRKSWGGLKFGNKMDPSTHERDRAKEGDLPTPFGG